MRIFLSAAWAAAAMAQPGAAADWPASNGAPGAQRYSEADEIRPENVGRLTRVWTYRTGHANAPKEMVRRSKFQATPILAGDKLVLCTPFNQAIALYPETGREIWRFDAKIDPEQEPANGFNCRGVSHWSDSGASGACANRIMMGTNDRRLIALDRDTGERCADFGANGEVAIEPEIALRWPGEMQITSAPAIVGDVVIVGSAIADNLRLGAPSGAVRAFDVRSGRELWRFDPVPRGEEAKSLGWRSEGAPQEGHANVWAPMSVDPARGLVFLPTSSPSPDFFGGLRPGDNRHANSVVALDAATGALRWAFQLVHHDVWDYDTPSAPILATITKAGAPRDVVIQTTKMGLVFTLDRESGEPVFPVEERRVPQGGAPGETLSPTQPFPSAPKPLVRSVISPEDAFGLTPFDRAACRKAIAGLRSEGLYTPPSIGGTAVMPFTGGGANWGGAAFDPHTNRLFVPVTNMIHRVALVPRENTDEEHHDLPHGEQAPMRGAPYAMQRQVLLSPLGLPCNPPPWGELKAVDMATGETAWSSVLGTTEDLAFGVALKTGTPSSGGPFATRGGLVFIAAALDRYLRAFDAASGAELWVGRLPAGGQAGPMTYVWKGRQYVVQAAGGHSEAGTKRGDYVLAFALPRAGEPGPGPVARFIDRPGRRLALSVCAVVAAALAFLLLARRVSPRSAARRSSRGEHG